MKWALRIAGGIAALAVITAAVLWFAPSGDYILLPDKAQPVAPLISVGGRHMSTHDKGRIYFLAVLVRKASLLEDLFPGIRSGATLVPSSELVPPGISAGREQHIEQEEMTQSQRVAATVALRELGYKIPPATPDVTVSSVRRDMPAARKLRPGDHITAVNGKPVCSSFGLASEFVHIGAGKPVRLTLRRNGRVLTIRLRLVADPRLRGRPVVGITVGNGRLPRHLPVRVRINPGSVVGPSAGLAFALEIMKKLGHNVTAGRDVAATGELAPNGCLIPIGGVEQKTIEAKNAHADVLLLPAGDNAAVARRYAGSMRVVPVESFQQALHKLATAAKNP